MAKLSNLNVLPDGLPSDPAIGSQSDENEGDNNPQGEVPWDMYLVSLEDDLASQTQSESKDSQQELVSTQLILETTAALGLSRPPQQATEYTKAVELSNLLNSSRAPSASLPPTRTSQRLPIRANEPSTAPAVYTDKLKHDARPDSAPQSSGKLRKPTKAPEDLGKWQRRKRDQYELLSSAQSTPRKANTTRGSTVRRGTTRRSNIAQNGAADPDRDELQASASPMVRRVSKSIEKVGLEIGSSPPSSSHRRRSTRLRRGNAMNETGTTERSNPVEVVVRHKKRKSNEDIEEVEVAKRQPPKRGRPARVTKTQELENASNGTKSGAERGLAGEASNLSRPAKRGRPRLTEENIPSADLDGDAQDDDEEVQKVGHAKRGRPSASQKLGAPATSSKETRSNRNTPSQKGKSNKAVLGTQAQLQATRNTRGSRSGVREQSAQIIEDEDEEEAEEIIDNGPQQSSNNTVSQVRSERQAQGSKAEASRRQTTRSSQLAENGSSQISPDAIEDEDESEDQDEEHPERTLVQNDQVGVSTGDEDIVHELYGQMPTLRKMVKTIKELNRKLPFITNTGREISKECRDTGRVFGQAASGDDLEPDEEPLNSTLANIHDIINGLKVNSTNEVKLGLVQDIYARTFPSLVSLLINIIKYYATKVPESSSDEYALDTDSLATVLEFVELILSLEDSVKTWPEKPDTSLAIVRPIRHNIIKPLRSLARAFSTELRRQRKAVASRRAREALDQEWRQAEEQAARRREDAAKLAARKAHWHVLHVARMWCEPDVGRHGHLHMKSQIDDAVDLDANGVRFERVTVFKDRDGSSWPEQGGGTPLEGPEWTDEQCLALLDGLRVYQGE
ncbi:hypothetical protein AOQ84DRAFT_19007 [Glonium stellatum]|uniref:Uncharacterized protein n=1 Tax=Glonium stellatum TaxID=574774 RepID=A0A8E2F3D9_9PEZI|nr:hypothetical protein AOQ84DRAFT_19007 [Glonium stellatum]